MSIGVVDLVELEAEPAPVAGEHETELVASEGAVMVGEAHAAVELGVAREAPLHAGHADQDHTPAGAVEDNAHELERRSLHPLGLVDDDELRQSVCSRGEGLCRPHA